MWSDVSRERECHDPRRGPLLIIFSCGVIAVALAWASLRIFAQDPILVVVGILIISPLAMWISAQQIRATFRHSPEAARNTSELLWLLGAFTGIGFGIYLLCVLCGGRVDYWDVLWLAGSGGMTTLNCFAAYLNRRWQRELEDVQDKGW